MRRAAIPCAIDAAVAEQQLAPFGGAVCMSYFTLRWSASDQAGRTLNPGAAARLAFTVTRALEVCASRWVEAERAGAKLIAGPRQL